MKKSRTNQKVTKVACGRRGGRPQLDESERRTGRINVPLNSEEKTLIIERAVGYHMSGAFFLRELGLGHRMRRTLPAINLQAYQELGRMGVNLNRVVGLINQGQAVGISREFAEELYDLLQATRRALLGGRDGDREDQQGEELQRPADLPLQREGKRRPGARTGINARAAERATTGTGRGAQQS
jgi:hypothetical protein